MDDTLFKSCTVLVNSGVLSDIDSCEAELIITGNYLILINDKIVHDQWLAAVYANRLAGLQTVDVNTAVEIVVCRCSYSRELRLIRLIRIKSDSSRK